jgi:hypothetical protein
MLAPAPFIVGVGRSGTTLLRLMLDSHPEIAIPTETHFLANLIDREGDTSKDEFLQIVTGAPTWPNMALENSALERALNEINPFSLSHAIRAFYRLYARQHGKRLWGDKTPPYRAFMPHIQRLLPEAHFIQIIRDGRDVALSYRGLWFGPSDDVAAQAAFWLNEVRAAQTQASRLPHYLEIRYEQLVLEPEETLRTICNYLKLPFNSSMLSYHESAPARLAEFKVPFGPPGMPSMDLDRFIAIHENTKRPPAPERVGRWRSEMSEEEQTRYEAIAGPLLAELGYETRFYRHK